MTEEAETQTSNAVESDVQPSQPPSLGDFFELAPDTADEQIQRLAERHISALVEAAKDIGDYNVLVLYDARRIDRSDANRIYSAFSDIDRTRSTLLVLRSPGGEIAASYFIGKLCREHTKGSFDVAVPREAKSAATLICCGADVIHMGSLSELGPIDPQVDRMPALAAKHSLEHVAEIASRYPRAKEMLSEYLSKSLPVNVVGYFERAAGSAVQYAERLLSKRLAAFDSARNGEIGSRLVYHYKDHGFAIDAREAVSIFGEDKVKTNTPQYNIGNQIYEQLDLIEFIVGRKFNLSLAFTGGLAGGCKLYRREESGPSA